MCFAVNRLEAPKTIELTCRADVINNGLTLEMLTPGMVSLPHGIS